MDPLLKFIDDGIKEFGSKTGARRQEMIVVVGPELLKYITAKYPSMGKVYKEYKTVFGVELVVTEKLKDHAFGVSYKECKDHIDDHIDEMMAGLNVPEFIQCRLCKHPLTTLLAQGDDIKCLWCGDVNDLEDIKGDC